MRLTMSLCMAAQNKISSLLGLFCISLAAQAFDSDSLNSINEALLLERVNAHCEEFNQQVSIAGYEPRNKAAFRNYLRSSAEYVKCINQQIDFLEFTSIPDSPFQATPTAFLAKASTQASFAQQWFNLNKANLWEPADGRDPVTKKLLHESIRAGDQARAVFGRIPAMSCDAADAKILRTQVDGNQIQLLDNPDYEDLKQFAHIDSSGKIVKWTDEVKQCDKPSIAGGVTECGTGSRIVYNTNKNVTWLLLCRKSLGENTILRVGNPRTDFDLNRSTDEPDSDKNYRYGDYWSEQNPFFGLVGLIGHNKKTGETAFFDGLKQSWNAYRFDETVNPPGGFGYRDRGFRAREIAAEGDETFYSNSFDIKCHACHDNKNPWILAPHTTFAEAGFTSVLRKRRFSAGKFWDLSQGSADQNKPFRIIGSEYIRRIDPVSTPYNEKTKGFDYLSSARSFSLKGCNACHTLTTQMTGRYFAYDAMGLVNETRPPRYIYNVEDPTEWERQWEFLQKARTEWGAKIGKIKQWMPIRFGSSGPSELIEPSPKELMATILGVDTEDNPDWYHTEIDKIRSRLDRCANVDRAQIDERSEECGYKNLYTECPVPELAPGELELSFGSDALHVSREAVSQTLSWQFKNNLGDVKDRDDVRFEAQLTRIPLLDGLAPSLEFRPEADRYELSELEAPLRTPGAPEQGVSKLDTEFEEFKATLNNIAPANQPIGTDPLPSDLARQYQLNMPPLQCGYRYIATVKALRFCFDGQKDQLSRKQGVSYIDVNCS